jgi:hypothetical protein
VGLLPASEAEWESELEAEAESDAGARRSASTCRALEMSRTARKRVAFVLDKARAVAAPRPEEQPVIRMTLSGRAWVRFSDSMMERAVGWFSIFWSVQCSL